MNAYNFSTKAEYFVAVAEWKEDYKVAAQANRNARQALKDAQRTYSKESTATNFSALHARYSERYQLKREANKLLETRQGMKVEAQRQYMAAKEVPAS